MRQLLAVSVSVCAALLFGAFARAGDDAKKAVEKALESLSGDWRIQKIQGGKFDKIEKGKEPTLTFSGNEATVKIAGMEETLKVTVDPSKKPAYINFVPSGDSEKAVYGIYKIEKDSLTICVSLAGETNRPTAFETGGDITRILVVLERVK